MLGTRAASGARNSARTIVPCSCNAKMRCSDRSLLISPDSTFISPCSTFTWDPLLTQLLQGPLSRRIFIKYWKINKTSEHVAYNRGQSEVPKDGQTHLWRSWQSALVHLRRRYPRHQNLQRHNTLSFSGEIHAHINISCWRQCLHQQNNERMRRAHNLIYKQSINLKDNRHTCKVASSKFLSEQRQKW